MKPRLPLPRTTFAMKVGVIFTLSLVANVSVTQVVEALGTTTHVDRRSRGFNLYSRHKEQRLGQKLSFEFERSVTIIYDQSLNSYLTGVVRNLAMRSDGKRAFEIKLIADEAIQAYSLPGGHLYLTTGLLLACSNEAELAGALSHEMAHDVRRHGTRQLTRQILLSSILAPAFVFGGNRAVTDLSVALGPLSFTSAGRRFEHEADLAGIQYAYFSGYDPNAFVDLLQRIGSQFPDKHSRIIEQFRTHPRISSRLKRLRQEISKLPIQGRYLVVDSSEFQDAKADLMVRLAPKPTGDEGAETVYSGYPSRR
jgi:predicted Zn-dependent protease